MSVQHLRELAQKLKDFAVQDKRVLAFYISGSYAKNKLHADSDLDPVFIVQEDAQETVEQDLVTLYDLSGCDLCIYTKVEFYELSTSGTSGMGSDRYDYAHLTVCVDKTGGEIQALIDKRGRLSQEETMYLGAGYLDGYINAFYRSFKSWRQSWTLAQHLEAAESVHYALAFLFAAEGRVKPFAKYLEWELQTHPLQLPMAAENLLAMINKILTTADIKQQMLFFESVCTYAAQAGFKDIIEAWEGKPEQLIKIIKS